MGALEEEGNWKAEGDPRKWREPLGGGNLSLEGLNPGPQREERVLGGKGDPWRVEVLVQSVDGGPQKNERDPRRWSPRGRRKLEGRGWPWRVEGIPESRGGVPKGGGLDLGPQETPQGQVDMETPGSSLLCNPAESPPGSSPPSRVHRTHPGRVHPKDKKALEDRGVPECRGLSQGPQGIPGGVAE